MADTIVDLEIRRKQTDGSYKIYHPVTKAKNVKAKDGTDLESHLADNTTHLTSTEHINLTNHLNDTIKHITANERTNWNNKLDKNSFYQVYYVSTTGNDNNDGSLSNPLRNIQTAINKCNPYLLANYEIILMDGFYNENLTINNFSGATLTIRGNTSDATKTGFSSISINNCNSVVKLTNLNVTYFTSNNNGIEIANCNCILLTNIQHIAYAQSNTGISVDCSKCIILNSTISGKGKAILSMDGSTVMSNNNVGNNNAIALRADYGGTIIKVAGTQPSGTTAEQSTNGGVIR